MKIICFTNILLLATLRNVNSQLMMIEEGVGGLGTVFNIAPSLLAQLLSTASSIPQKLTSGLGLPLPIPPEVLQMLVKGQNQAGSTKQVQATPVQHESHVVFGINQHKGLLQMLLEKLQFPLQSVNGVLVSTIDALLSQKIRAEESAQNAQNPPSAPQLVAPQQQQASMQFVPAQQASVQFVPQQQQAGMQFVPLQQAGMQFVPLQQAGMQFVPQQQAGMQFIPQQQANVQMVPQQQANVQLVPQQQPNLQIVPQQPNMQLVPQKQDNVQLVPQKQDNVQLVPQKQPNSQISQQQLLQQVQEYFSQQEQRASLQQRGGRQSQPESGKFSQPQDPQQVGQMPPLDTLQEVTLQDTDFAALQDAGQPNKKCFIFNIGPKRYSNCNLKVVKSLG